jgi:D-glycero-D-manno-heptose 1,7-bisphosphate phosphatase
VPVVCHARGEVHGTAHAPRPLRPRRRYDHHLHTARHIDTVFLDRDGVINRKAPDGDYIKSVSELELLPGVVDAVSLLQRAELRLVIVTNQRGIALGRMSAEAVAELHRDLGSRLGLAVDRIYVCPHGHGECHCRKPEPGLLEQARADTPEIDFARSAVVGDSPSDVELARRVGALAIGVGPRTSGADRVFDSLADASRWLVTAAARPPR